MAIIIGSILVLAFILIVWSNIHRRNVSWTGTIIDKGYNTSAQQGTGVRIEGIPLSSYTPNRNYYIVVKLDTGKELRWTVSDGLYNTLEIGQKVTKPVGTTIPELVQ